MDTYSYTACCVACAGHQPSVAVVAEGWLWILQLTVTLLAVLPVLVTRVGLTLGAWT